MTVDLKPYPAYKHSRVDWLGSIPEDWQVRRLGWCVGINKRTLPEDTSPNFEFAYLDISSVGTGRLVAEPERVTFASAPTRARRIVSQGDTLVSTVRTYLKATWCPDHLDEPFVCSTGFAVLSPGTGVPRFWGYVAQSEPFTRAVVSESVGVAYPAIDAERFRHLPTVLPPLEDQAAIVRFLDHVDARIERLLAKKERLIRLLEEKKRAIIHLAITHGLDPGVSLKPSGVDWLGDIPEHWEIIELGRMIDLLAGYPFPSESFSEREQDVRLLRGVNISPGEIRWNDVVRWPCELAGGVGAYSLAAGDLVLGLDRPIVKAGIRVARVTNKDVPSLLLQRVARIRAGSGLLSEYVEFLLSGEVFKRYISPIFTGVSVPHLSPEQVRRFRIARPPVDEQSEIVTTLKDETATVHRAIDVAVRQRELLAEFRTRLISDVVTGKLDVREAAANLPDDLDAEDPALDEQLEEVAAG